MTIGRLSARILAACLLMAAAPPAPDAAQESFALRIPIVVHDGRPVQRVSVPAAAMAAARSRDLADLRVFDSMGKPMPVARIAARARPARRDTLPALPILGTANALDITGVSLRLDGDDRARVVNVTGKPMGARDTGTVLGVLFDARRIRGRAQSLILHADLPVSQPITFDVEASADLKNWRELGEQVLYRAANRSDTLAIALTRTALRGEFVRVTWRADTRLIAPVTIVSGTLVTQPGTGPDRVSLNAQLPAAIDARTFAFAMPVAAPILGIGVVPTGSDILVPMTVYGRNAREQPWTFLGRGIAARDRIVGLDGGYHRQLRLEADDNTAGFTSPPDIRLRFASQHVAFLAAGTPPYVMAVGKADAVGAYLPLDSLMAQAAGQSPGEATTRSQDRVLQLPGLTADGAAGRQFTLWAMLLAATAALAVMVYGLWRRQPDGRP